MSASLNILLGIGGSIAACKTPQLVSLLHKRGHKVKVCISNNADQFVAPISLQALSGHRVYQQQFPPVSEDAMEHISLARWADCLVIAPASAAMIGKFANGLADDLPTTIALAATCPRYIAPAMNQAMWHNPTVQHNLHTLAGYGWKLLPVASGTQACGESGSGRMLEPEALVVQIESSMYDQETQPGWWHNKHLLITAGPTHEAIDPVRYIGNHSSGTFGYAIATAAAQLGARVSLISGPVQLADPIGVTTVRVTSARQMLNAAQQVSNWDVCIGTAAVADYAPIHQTDTKLHKNGKSLQLELVQNPDIIATLAHNRLRGQRIVGFCAETSDNPELIARARSKLASKNLDLVIANQVGEGLVFGQQDASIWLVYPDGETALPTASKDRQARTILDAITTIKS